MKQRLNRDGIKHLIAPFRWTIISIVAFLLAAALNYLLCVLLLFRHRARWNTSLELVIYVAVVVTVGVVDVGTTRLLVNAGAYPLAAKAIASVVGVLLNFVGRRSLVFPEPGRGPWRPQSAKRSVSRTVAPSHE